MNELVKTSKFWNYVGVALSLAGVVVAAVATSLGNDELEANVIEKVTNTLNEGIKKEETA